jgi:hypothetical protein
MRARNTVGDSLAYLWSTRRRVKRALFFSYRFSFRWFHDFVLPQLRKVCGPRAEITVVASRFGDEEDVFPAQAAGDLYGIEEWARFRDRFRVRYLPVQPVVHHAKFMLLELEGRSTPILGGGSANLTGSGWLRNAELWSWDERRCLSACREYLLSVSRSIGTDLLKPWIDCLPDAKPPVRWLFGDKAKARASAWAYLADKRIGKPLRLTIASPYFDEGSTHLLRDLLRTIEARMGDAPEVRLWIDGSGRLAQRKDYERLLGIVSKVPSRLYFPERQIDSGVAILGWGPRSRKGFEARGMSKRG